MNTKFYQTQFCPDMNTYLIRNCILRLMFVLSYFYLLIYNIYGYEQILHIIMKNADKFNLYVDIHKLHVNIILIYI